MICPMDHQIPIPFKKWEENAKAWALMMLEQNDLLTVFCHLWMNEMFVWSLSFLSIVEASCMRSWKLRIPGVRKAQWFFISQKNDNPFSKKRRTSKDVNNLDTCSFQLSVIHCDLSSTACVEKKTPTAQKSQTRVKVIQKSKILIQYIKDINRPKMSTLISGNYGNGGAQKWLALEKNVA